MLDLILMILLLFGLFIGLNRGFILQLFHLIGFITAFIIAATYYDDLANRLELWIPYKELSENIWPEFLQGIPIEMAFYNIISFAVIFFAVRIILQIVASMLDFVAAIPLIKPVNKILGAVLGFVEIYLIAFILLYVLALTPIETVQSSINNSSLALLILEQTPYFSNKLFDLVKVYL